MLKAVANAALDYTTTHPEPPVGARGPGGALWGRFIDQSGATN